MRKLLISILLVLLILMAFLCIKNGINIGPLHVLSVGQIQEANDELTKKINQAKSTNDDYNNKLTKLKQDISALIKSKEECLSQINASTESQLQDATQTKNYTIEYLWSEVGNHATKEGVNIKMDVTSGSIANSDYRNLKFTVTGNYLAMTNFISALENDFSLEFTIDNFEMTQNQCTFVVKDIKVQREKTTETNSNSEQKNENVDSNTKNANNTTNTTNQNEISNESAE